MRSRGSRWLITLQGRPFCSLRPPEVPRWGVAGETVGGFRKSDGFGNKPILVPPGSKLTLGGLGDGGNGAGSGVYIYHGNKVIWQQVGAEGIGTQSGKC